MTLTIEIDPKHLAAIQKKAGLEGTTTEILVGTKVAQYGDAVVRELGENVKDRLRKKIEEFDDAKAETVLADLEKAG